MRNTLWAVGLALLVAVSVAATRGPETQKWKYLTVRLPANVVEIEFDAGNKGAKLKSTVITPLDSLGRDGWELVAVTKDGTTYVCFFKAPQEPK